MADSKRQRIVSAIVTRMALINGAGDYETDVGGRVKDSETNWGQDQEHFPAISVFDGDAMGTPTSKGEPLGTIHTMAVLIKYYAEQGTTAANCRKGIKDIMTAIRVDDKFGGLVMQTREGRNAIARTEGSFEVEGAEVEIEVQFKTSKLDAT
jgi:hypothetical protein